MRAREFLSESKLSLLEGLMKQSGNDNDWLKDKYYEPFFEGLEAGQIYAFNVVTSEKPEGSKKSVKTENRFLGIIQDPPTAIAQMKRAIKLKDFSNVYFDVEEVDNQTFEPTGEIWENVIPKQIYKDEKIKGEIDPNMGNVSEAILGCAVAAKFSNLGSPINEAQVVNVAKQLAKNKGSIRLQAGKDVLEFKVSIPFMDNKAFYAWLEEDSRGKTLKDYNVSDIKIALFDQRLKSAIEYANNSKRIAGAVDEAVSDPRENKIDVISDGAEKANQNTTKVDLKILIDGKESAKRLISVKAGDVEQFGQAGGHNFNNLNDFFTSIVGIPLPESIRNKFYEIPERANKSWNDKKLYNFQNSFSNGYAYISKQLSSMAKSDPEGLVENIYQGLLQHLTRKEEGVEMVILEPGDQRAFAELRFGTEFEQALRQLQLFVEFRQETGYVISIYGLPKTDLAKKFTPAKRGEKARLIDLRSQFDKRTQAVRNRINMGPLLKNIADIENYIEQAQQDTEPPVNAPIQSLNTPAKSTVVPAKLDVQQPAPTPPGIVNQNRTMAQGKIPMGTKTSIGTQP
jgi:hypothetical protein